MSRATPIKKILNRLEWEQFVKVIPRTGSMVTEIQFGRVMNVYQVRFGIETLEINLTKNHFSPEDCTQLEDFYNTCGRLLDPKNSFCLGFVHRHDTGV
jgi:DNA-binding GntR family transcriptional regulator